MFGLFKDGKFRNAVKNGNLTKVNELINDGVDVNICDDDSSDTPIIIRAVEIDSKEIVAALLTAGSDAMRKNSEGNTPLLVSLNRGFLGITKLLIEHHIDLDGGDDEISAALDFSIKNDSPESVLAIVNTRANVDAQIQDGSLMQFALKHTDFTLAKTLLGRSERDEFELDDVFKIFLPCLKNIEDVAQTLLQRAAYKGSIDGMRAQFVRSKVSALREKNVSIPFNKVLKEMKKLLPSNKKIQGISEILIKNISPENVIAAGAEVSDCEIALEHVIFLRSEIESISE